MWNWRCLFKPFGARVVVVFTYDGLNYYRFVRSFGNFNFVSGFVLNRLFRMLNDGTFETGYFVKWYDI